MDARAGLDEHRPRQLEQGREGLERGIGEGALVLHLEQVAVELDLDLGPTPEAVADRSNVRERKVGGDQRWEPTAERAPWRVNDEGRARQLLGMKHAQPDARGEEWPPDEGIELDDQASRVAADCPRPFDVHVVGRAPTLGRQANLEARGATPDVVVRECGLDRAPALIAHGGIDAGDHLLTGEADAAHGTVLKARDEWAGLDIQRDLGLCGQAVGVHRRRVCATAAAGGRSGPRGPGWLDDGDRNRTLRSPRRIGGLRELHQDAAWRLMDEAHVRSPAAEVDEPSPRVAERIQGLGNGIDEEAQVVQALAVQVEPVHERPVAERLDELDRRVAHVQVGQSN